MDKLELNALIERLELHTKIVDEVPALISYVDTDLRYRLVNRGYSEWFQVEADEFVGKTVQEIVGDLAYEALLPEIETVLSGENVSFERTLHYKNGVQRYVRGSLIPDIGESGEVRGYITLLLDETHRHEMESALSRSEERFSKMFNFIPVPITISSLRDHRYVEVNEAYLRIGGRQHDEVIGKTGSEMGISMPDDKVREFFELLTTVGTVSNFETEITIKNNPSKTQLISAVVLEIGGEPFLAACGVDITERKKAETLLRDLSTRMFNLQDDERRRLARELHDTTAQKLSAQLLNLSYLKKLLADADPEVKEGLAETIELAEQALGEIRTLSYVLHPPLLDKAGLHSALRWLADGFMKRSGITVEFASAGAERRLPQEMEGAIFRIVQEALTNIQRHSESKSAFIIFDQNPRRVHLEIRDEGIGFVGQTESMVVDETHGLGIGIMSMRERIRQFGGEMTIWTGSTGTKIIAEIPLT